MGVEVELEDAGIPIGLGFIGCGKHAFRSHAAVVAHMPELFSTQSVFDINEEAMERFSALLPGAQHAKSAEDLLANPAVQAVIIATPHGSHLDLMRKAVQAGKHVMCEKPLWVDQDDDFQGIDIIREAERKNLIFTSCHPRRFEPIYLDLRHEISGLEDRLGSICELNYRFFYHVPPSGWRQNDSLLIDHVNHEVDIVRHLLGPVHTRLRVLNDGGGQYCVQGHRLDDDVALTFAGYRELGEKIYRNEIELVFERGRVRRASILKKETVTVESVYEDFQIGPPLVDPVGRHYRYDTAFAGMMENFAQAIRFGKERSYVDVEDLILNTTAGTALLKTGEYFGF